MLKDMYFLSISNYNNNLKINFICEQQMSLMKQT